MPIYRSNAGDTALVSLDEDDDLLDGLTRVAGELAIQAGSVQVIGAVKKLVLGYYDQDEREYRMLEPGGHFEIASGLGNISLKDGAPFVHLHVVASDESGAALGGHVMPGNVVFAAEAWISVLSADTLPERHPEERRGLALWG
jgi:predicted DNA-binding protein with PD1-like motif